MSVVTHANARTTPKTRAEIQAGAESVAVLARRYNVSEPTVRLWRSSATQADGRHVRHNLGQSTSPEQEAKGLYLVGAGTHPGAGLPGGISSAEVLGKLVPDAPKVMNKSRIAAE